MKWIKASERLPEANKKVIGRSVVSGYVQYFKFDGVNNGLVNEAGIYHSLSLIEWLDESLSPDNQEKLTPKQKLEQLQAEIDELSTKAKGLRDEYVKENPEAKKGILSLFAAFEKVISRLDAAYNVNLYDDMD